jgi:heme o synthase
LIILRLLLEKNNHILKLTVFLSLIKYKLSLAVAFSAATGYFICRNTFGPDFFLLIPGIFLLTTGSAVLNQFMEREQDAKMGRTRERPVASGKITHGSAILVFSFLLFSGGCLVLLTGLIPFTLGCLGVIFYNLLYTPLKKVTLLAIIPGAVVGAIPPLIGYSSACGTTLNIKILFFSAFMFLWQIPHFWLLLLRYGKEYQTAGFRTIYDYLTEKQIKYLVSFVVLLSAACLNCFCLVINLLSNDLSTVIVILTVIFLMLFFKYLFISKKSHNPGNAFIVFNTYSFAIMLIMISDSVFRGI